jgi:nitroimidazol reductase NimA-like FMN-containing flavoprotein (pyridoxamine 5'-phosphate oxidase superfamily)
VRKARKEIRNRTVIEDLLRRAEVGRLGTVGRDGYPMVKPLNFAYHEGAVYVHSAPEGEKIDDIRRDNRVCFEVDHPIAFVRGAVDDPCTAEYLFRSVIIKGRAAVVEDREERVAALAALMRKYQPGGGYGDFREEKLRVTSVIRITVEQMTGKEDLGREHHRDAVNKALQDIPGRTLVLDP